MGTVARVTMMTSLTTIAVTLRAMACRVQMTYVPMATAVDRSAQTVARVTMMTSLTTIAMTLRAMACRVQMTYVPMAEAVDRSAQTVARVGLYSGLRLSHHSGLRLSPQCRRYWCTRCWFGKQLC